jgi:hypothetical protein
MKIDVAIRHWARRDKPIARRLQRVDNRRMEYMRSLFAAFCHDPDEVELRCLLFASLAFGTNFLAADHRLRSRADVVELAMRRLLA